LHILVHSWIRVGLSPFIKIQTILRQTTVRELLQNSLRTHGCHRRRTRRKKYEQTSTQEKSVRRKSEKGVLESLSGKETLCAGKQGLFVAVVVTGFEGLHTTLTQTTMLLLKTAIARKAHKYQNINYAANSTLSVK
jgi:hypothetical protein